MPNKVIIDYTTNTSSMVDLTADKIAELEAFCEIAAADKAQ